MNLIGRTGSVQILHDSLGGLTNEWPTLGNVHNYDVWLSRYAGMLGSGIVGSAAQGDQPGSMKWAMMMLLVLVCAGCIFTSTRTSHEQALALAKQDLGQLQDELNKLKAQDVPDDNREVQTHKMEIERLRQAIEEMQQR